jgi:hypothetical protein
MTEETRRQRIQQILDRHDRAVEALQQARELGRTTHITVHHVDGSVATSIAGMRTVLDGLAAASDSNQMAFERSLAMIDAQGRAMDLVREANQMAIALLNEL